MSLMHKNSWDKHLSLINIYKKNTGHILIANKYIKNTRQI